MRRAAVCSSEQTDSPKIGQLVSAAALAVALSFGTVQAAHADISGLTPCSESKGFNKRQKQEVKALKKRLAKVSSRSAHRPPYPVARVPGWTLRVGVRLQYEAGSAPALALQATIERTEKRFANYAKAGLLCGTDGLPHLISDPGLALRYGHAGETLVSIAVSVL